jgi:hypothetical protein
MAEIPKQSPESEPKETSIEDVKEYFSSMPDFNDDQDLTSAINNGSRGDFFGEITTKDGQIISAYGLAVRDVVEYKRAEDDYEREGKIEKVNKYKKAGDKAKKVVAFLDKLVLEREQKGIEESGVEKIIGAIKNDPAQQEQQAEVKKKLDELYEAPPIDVGAGNTPDFSNTETTGQLSDKPFVEPEQVKKNEWGDPIMDITPPPEIPAQVETKPEKKEREYDKLGRQLGEFKVLWGEKKDEEVIKLAKEMAGKKVKDAEEAKEIYKKKSGLYKTATKIIESSRIRKQLKEIADAVREAGEYKKGGKTIKIKKEDKIDGRLFFKNDKYYFEFGGKLFLVEKKLVDKKGKAPLKADVLPVPLDTPPPLPEEPPALPDQPQEEPPELPPELPSSEQAPPALPERPPVLPDQPVEAHPSLPEVEQSQTPASAPQEKTGEVDGAEGVRASSGSFTKQRICDIGTAIRLS